MAAKQLVLAGIASGRLDAEIILAHTLRKSRTFLHAHGDEPIPSRERDIAGARLALRLDRTPLAYIIGHKEFYGRNFRVTPAVLIPRPESEMMITLLKDIYGRNLSLLKDTPLLRLVDVGTGTGCLGITAKLEFPELDVTLLDTSRHALKVAETNAEKLQAKVHIHQSDLLSHYPLAATFILANLPYVDKEWERSPETDYEPESALFAADNGLVLIKQLIQEAPSRLTKNGLLFLEADPCQHKAILAEAKQQGFVKKAEVDFIIVLQKA